MPSREYRLAHLEDVRRKSREYGKRYEAGLNASISQIFGRACQNCGVTEKRLSLAHIVYEADSVMPAKKESHAREMARKREAIAHPERFRRLCISCHGKSENRYWKKNYGKRAQGIAPLSNVLLAKAIIWELGYSCNCAAVERTTQGGV
jgi:5-methylcytosine-specific restriction endonuclease McrA